MVKKLGFCVLSLLICLPGTGLAATGSQSTSNLTSLTVSPTQDQSTVSSSQTSTSQVQTLDVTDTAGPQLVSATMSPSTAQVGDTVTITAKVTDDISGVGEVDAYLYNDVNGGSQYVPLSYDSSSDTWSGTYTVGANDPDGTWGLELDLFDNVGNYNYAPTDQTVQFVNSNADTQPPVVTSVDLPQSVNAGDQFTVTANVTDNVGVADVTASLFSPDGYWQEDVPLTYDSSKDVWSSSYAFSPTAQPGNWTIEFNSTDAAGNPSVYDRVVTVNNPNADTAGPVISDVTASSQTVKAGDSVTVTAKITDDKSGINYAYALLQSSDGYGIGSPLTLDPTTGLYKATIGTSSNAKPGTYTVTIESSDSAGNYVTKNADQPVTVQNDGDYTPPVVTSFTKSADTAKPGDVINFTATVTDDKSTVNSVSVDLRSPNYVSRTVSLTYNSSLKQWTGSYTVGTNDQPGTWQISVGASDSAYNYGSSSQGTISIDNSTGDFTPPTITSVDVSPSTVKVGNQVTFTVQASDTQSDVNKVTVNLNSQIGYGYRTVNLTYDSNSKAWTGTYTVDKFDPNGTWNIYVNAYDTANNVGANYSPKTVIFDNPQYDNVNPVLDSVDLSSASASKGQDVVITVKAHDDNSGLQAVNGNIVSPSGINRYIDFALDSSTGNWVGRYTVGANDEPGQWTLSEIDLRDNFNNYVSTSVNKTFTVDNPDADFTAPTLDSVTVSTPTANVGDSVKFTVKAHDDKSGIQYVNGYLQSADYHTKYLNFSYNKSTDEWVATGFAGIYDASGDYSLQLNISDKAGNTYDGQDLAKVTFNNPDADSNGPTVSNIQLSKTTVGVGERVTVTADVTDDKSGVMSVNAFFNNTNSTQYASKSVTMRYDSTTNKWVGNFDVLDTTVPGNWTVNIGAVDKAGNPNYGQSLNQTLTITNPNGDYTGPTINGVTASSTNVNAGDQVTFTADVTDPSGVASVSAYASYLSDLTFVKDKTTGKWTATTTIPTNVPDGTQVQISNISAQDVKGNNSNLWSYTTALTVHNSTGDTTPPKVEDVQISQTDVKPGDTIQIKAKVTDSQSGVDSVDGNFGNNGSRYINFSYDEASGYWIANYKVGPYEPTDQLELNLIVNDKNQNGDSQATGKYINVNNPNTDTNAPVIDSLQITPATANVGDTVTLKANVTDNESGVSTVLADIGLSYNTVTVPLTYDASQKAYIGTYKIKANDQSGKWEVNLNATDFYYNTAYYYGMFTVNNQDGDVTAPYLDTVKLSSSAANVGDTINFETKIIDDQSGVKSASIVLPIQYGDGVTIPLMYDAVKGTWTGSYTVPSYSSSGNHALRVVAEDNAGNQMDEYTDYNLYIANDHPDNDPPVIGKASVTQDQVAAGDTVQLNVNVSDAGSDVASVTADVYNVDSYNYYAGYLNDATKTIKLVKDTVQNTWTGSYTIQPYDQPGDWAFNINAKDNAGNMSYVNGAANFTIIVKSPKYGDATWYYDNKNYFNAVYYAGLAIGEGDTRAEVQTLMNNAAQALLDAAATMSSADATNAYQLLVSAKGVPSDIVTSAQAKLVTVVTSPKYDDALWYNYLGNYYNTVFFAAAALNEGDTRAQDLLNTAAQSLYDTAATMNSNDAQNAYQLLANTTGVPGDIATAANGKLTPAVRSPKYDDAEWYNSLGNYYNTVYFAAAALNEGDTRAQDLLNTASKALLDAAASMGSNDAQNAYQLLANTTGVPSDIATTANGKLTPVVKSAKYDDAQWYNSLGNYYNTVYFAAEALKEGDTRAQDLLNTASKALLDGAASMGSNDAQNAYQLLANTTGVPSDIVTAANGKLTPVVKSAKYDDAQWYNSLGNYYNTVYFAAEAVKDGDTRAQDLLNTASKSLLDAAASMGSNDAQNAYQLLANTTGVPSDIVTAANGKLTPVVKSAKYDDAQWYNSLGNYYNTVYFASEALKEGDTRAQDLLNTASQALFDSASTMSSVDAQNAYQLLANTTGVPTDIQTQSSAKIVN